MNEKNFVVIMPGIISKLSEMISREQNITEEDATKKLYNSKLYEYLEKEDTKVWHYSTLMLYNLFLEGEKTGKISFPDV